MNNLILKELAVKDAYRIFLLQEKYADPRWFTHRDIYSIFYACENDRCVGLFKDNKLVAYSIFSYACNLDKEYLPEMDIEQNVGKFSGTVVSCDYKGLGIQRFFLNSHIDFAKENNIKFIMSYVHADNHFSKKNLDKVGLKSTGTKFICHKNEDREVYLMQIKD